MRGSMRNPSSLPEHSFSPADPDGQRIEIDTSVAHPARVYDYLIGGADHFPVDIQAAERGSAALPGGVDRAREMTRSQRAFLASAVSHLVGEMGVRQFLDIGTGIPAGDNVHAVAQQTAPECRVVYVDKDPIVLAHAHKLLKSTPEGATDFLQADFRDPDLILSRAAPTLDYTQPVGLILVGILHLIPDEDDPWAIVGRLLDAVPSGSYATISHMASDLEPELVEAIRVANETMSEPFILRTRSEVARFLDGLDAVGPGIVTLDRWPWSEWQAGPPALPVAAYCAVARKP